MACLMHVQNVIPTKIALSQSASLIETVRHAICVHANGQRCFLVDVRKLPSRLEDARVITRARM